MCRQPGEAHPLALVVPGRVPSGGVSELGLQTDDLLLELISLVLALHRLLLNAGHTHSAGLDRKSVV